jgi:hypothetical protein
VTHLIKLIELKLIYIVEKEKEKEKEVRKGQIEKVFQ